jgi:hypothetical protein
MSDGEIDDNHRGSELSSNHLSKCLSKCCPNVPAEQAAPFLLNIGTSHQGCSVGPEGELCHRLLLSQNQSTTR